MADPRLNTEHNEPASTTPICGGSSGEAARPRVTVVLAVYNEQENLPELRQRAEKVMDDIEGGAEIIAVDDHSSDGTSKLLHEWAAADSRVTALRLARNCGSHAAWSAGLAQSRGACAVIMASDLQDPPELVTSLVAKWSEGYHVVWAERSAREGESLSTRIFSRLYYAIMRAVALPDMPSTGADVVLVDRKVIDAYNAIAEKHTSLLAMILWMGFRQTSISYVKQSRHAGRSKWTLARKIKLVVDSVVSFSGAPIRLISLLGCLMAGGGLLYALFVILGRLTGWVNAETGFAALMTVLLVGQGCILLTLGILGEYLWRTFDQARGRPRYILEECVTSDRRALAPEKAAETPPGETANKTGSSAR